MFPFHPRADKPVFQVADRRRSHAACGRNPQDSCEWPHGLAAPMLAVALDSYITEEDSSATSTPWTVGLGDERLKPGTSTRTDLLL